MCTDRSWADTVAGPYENSGFCGEPAKLVWKGGTETE